MLENENMIELYKTMLKIRIVERRIESEYKYDEIKTPIHLSIGQEAIAAGVCAHLKKEDYLFGTHRSHSQYLAKGGDLNKMIAEMYLRTTGCALGRGGSMHLVDPDVGVMGSSAIVGGSIPLGTGAGLAAKLQKTDRVTAIFFGDGAVDEGVFHECLNFASLKKLPVIYVCENNHYAINSHELQRHSEKNIYRLAQSYNMASEQMDGNDVLQVAQSAEAAVERARSGGGPTFLECITYRWKGHIGTVDDVGDGYRPVAEHAYWVSKCPIKWFAGYLKETGILTDELEQSIHDDISRQVEEAFVFAKNSPKPRPEDLMDHVYAS